MLVKRSQTRTGGLLRQGSRRLEIWVNIGMLGGVEFGAEINGRSPNNSVYKPICLNFKSLYSRSLLLSEPYK